MGSLYQGFRHKVTRLAGANAIAYAVALLSAPLLSRLYSPEDYGAFGLFIAFLSFSVAVGGLRFELGIVSAESDSEALRLACLALASGTVAGIAAGGAFACIISLGVIGTESLPLWWSLALAVSVALAIAYATVRYTLLYAQDVRSAARGVISQSIGRVVAQIVLGATLPAGGLVGGETVGRAVGLAAIGRPARRILHRPWPAPRDIVITARRHYRYPLYSVPSSLSDVAVTFLPLPAIAALYGFHAAGLYAFVQRVVALPLGVIGQAMADAFHSELATYFRIRPSDMSRLFRRTTHALLAAGAVVAATLIVGGLTVFGTILGPEWSAGGIVLAILAPAVAAQLVVSPLSRAVYVLGGQRSKLGYDAIALGGVVGAIVAATVAHWTFVELLSVLTAAQVATRTVYFLIVRRLIKSVGNGAQRDVLPTHVVDD